MGIMVYSLLWVMQDFVHQPLDFTSTGSKWRYMGVSENRGALVWGPDNKDPTI